MPFYITPPRITKEAFLERYGAKMTRQAFRAWRFFERGHSLPVALVIGDETTIARVLTSTPELVEFLKYHPENLDIEFYGIKFSDMINHRVMAPEALEKVALSL